jgi:acyl-lipid omega-6 desaturase (Delta-12 desaturase)
MQDVAPQSCTPANTAPSTDHLRKLCAPYAKANVGKAIFQLANTLPAFLLLLATMGWLWTHDYSYFWVLALAVPAAGLYVRLFIFQHDCGHGSFFASERANNAVGGFLGVLTMFPYAYWRKTHNIHHGSSGNLDRRELGDVETLTVAEYHALSWFRRLCYRWYRSMPIMLGVGPMYQFVIKHRLPFDLPLSWKREWLSVIYNNIALLSLLLAFGYYIGFGTVLAVYLPVVLIAGAGGIWLFYVQHQFEEAYWKRGSQWQAADAALSGSSFFDLPAPLRWFTGNIGYHHIHHLTSRIPNYHLRACHEQNPELQRAPRITLFSSFRCAKFKLWDEDLQRMVGFPRRRARA